MTTTGSQSPGAQKPKYYRNVPLVDLLPGDRGGGLRLFGVAGTRLAVRAGLVLLVVAFALLVQVNRQADEDSKARRVDVVRETARGNRTIGEGVTLEARIDELRETGDITAQDFAFLTAQPTELIAAIRGVFARRIEGITINSVETVPPDVVNIQLGATSNSAAFEWQTTITEEQAIDRVSAFEEVSTGEGVIDYDAAIVARGR